MNIAIQFWTAFVGSFVVMAILSGALTTVFQKQSLKSKTSTPQESMNASFLKKKAA